MIGRHRIAVFYQADAYGRSGWDGIRKALREKELDIVAETTYRRGASFNDSMQEQACAAFVRDARNAGIDIPICNLSFVGSENMLQLLSDLSRSTGKDYTHDL
ncbi:ABC transporter substrate-binding protein, partial [Aduncisulcus paluster]